ncbi:hypothetical protein NUW54_g6498 [Trametes sanguinea]|uniref:Uncharacterized protein n=2 Tax=Trametes sanguinea TaxID=158606 RepID=A0ACC1PU69_9APHY|nr:hypothetical protein NUW54_g8171 [Trametes sanguinea]KAJ3001323.1 hypothetical protein NUW54_g6498 [Trametes sanguinea]
MFSFLALILFALLGRSVHAGPLTSIAHDTSLSLPVSELNVADVHVVTTSTRGGLSPDATASVDPGSQIAICGQVNCQECSILNLGDSPVDECTSVGQFVSTAFIDPTPPTFNLSIATQFCGQEVLIPERNVCFNVNGAFFAFVIHA